MASQRSEESLSFVEMTRREVVSRAVGRSWVIRYPVIVIFVAVQISI
jgi:hypothetical protein